MEKTVRAIPWQLIGTKVFPGRNRDLSSYGAYGLYTHIYVTAEHAIGAVTNLSVFTEQDEFEKQL